MGASGTLLHCTVLYCTALYCTTPYVTALHCTALHYNVLYCTALCCTTLYCTALHCSALHYTHLHCTVLHYSTLQSTELYCLTPRFTALNCTFGFFPHWIGSLHWADSVYISRNVRDMSVCLSMYENPVIRWTGEWRLLVEECITNNSTPLNIFSFQSIGPLARCFL